MRRTYRITYRDKTLDLGKRTCLMGVVNLTPDSFYDGGRYSEPEPAVAHALQLAAEGADILDLGGQSTRPAAERVGAEEELRRILPVLRQLRSQTRAWISIDTYNNEVAQTCLREGADMINDVSSFREDAAMAGLVARSGVPVVCMHFLQSIHPMPSQPEYKDLFGEIRSFFQRTIDIATDAGIRMEQLILDPGIGFGKNLDHNLQIIKGLSFLSEFDRPILAGPSRKSFIEKLTGLPVDQRLEGTAAAAAVCLVQGAHILRVHDVAFFRRFCAVFDALL